MKKIIYDTLEEMIPKKHHKKSRRKSVRIGRKEKKNIELIRISELDSTSENEMIRDSNIQVEEVQG